VSNYGLKFNTKHSINDFHLIMEYKYVHPPQKKKIKAEVPYMNYFYDFSTVGTNGEPVFTSRQIDVKLSLLASGRTKESLQVLYTMVMQWLLYSGKSQLIFDDMPDVYFMAEVEQISNWEELQWTGSITFSFIAEPFKRSIDYIGDVWDTFNFELDIVQDVEFDVVTTKMVSIYNVGIPVMPVLNVNTNMSIVYNSKSYSLLTGDNSFYSLKLANGYNTIVINGTGHIKFLYRKELL